jgi:signal transduction histidine kinase
MRLVIILLLLVVLPTAILSLIAGRSIQEREVILNRRLEQRANERLERVSAHMTELLNSDLTAASAAFRETVLAGMSPKAMWKREKSLVEGGNFVGAVYLFMNPWNFVYPRASEKALSGSNPMYVPREILAQKISAALKRGQPYICFQHLGRSFCFIPIKDYPDMYCGIQLGKHVQQALKRMLQAESSAGIELRMGLLKPESGGQTGAVISDSFSSRPYRAPRLPRINPTSDCLASRHLPAPFFNIEISAYVVGGDELLRAEALEGNLIRWGVFLLAVVIVVSSLILILTTVRQAAAARRRSEFVVGMSHDLRTPVAAMQVLADSLCAGRVSSQERQKEFVCSIASECGRLGDLIERVLFVFRQEHGALSYTMKLCDMDELVGVAVDNVRPRLPQGFCLKLELTADGPHFVKCDASALDKVLVNLLDNAIKYGVSVAGGESSITVRVSRQQHRHRNWVVVAVRDCGQGIASHEHKKIFRRFYRVGADDQGHIGGIGLGLFLCYDIVKEHGGRITVDSSPAKGAEFKVWLRAVQAPAESV